MYPQNQTQINNLSRAMVFVYVRETTDTNILFGEPLSFQIKIYTPTVVMSMSVFANKINDNHGVKLI